MESDSQTGLQTFNAREIFAVTLRVIERLEKVDQGVFRRGKVPLQSPGEKLQTNSEEVLLTFENKRRQLEKALTGLQTLGLELGKDLAEWYSVRRGHYSQTLLRTVRLLWQTCVGERGFEGTEELQCELFFAVLRKQKGKKSSSIGPHLKADPSPRLHFEFSDSGTSSDSETGFSVDSEENVVTTQEDARWEQFRLPASASINLLQ